MSKLRKILKPISLLYGEVVKVRNKMYDNGMLDSIKFETPTIVVGNLSVGGTGKSPMIEYLIRLLKDDYKVAVLSRGYKRTSKGFQLATNRSTVAEIGDEPMQFYKKFDDVIVAVDAKRVNGIQQLKALENPPDVILLDDAFQHRKVQGGFNILLTPHYNLYIDDSMLPSGDLRENIKGAKRADVILVTKCPDDIDENEQFEITKKLNIELTQTAFFTKIGYDEFVYSKADKIKLTDLKNYEIILVTGIAKTSPLTSFLNTKQLKFKHLEYKDHHNFTERDLEKIHQKYTKIVDKKKLILTTEKDYVRTFEVAKEKVYYLPIKTEFLSAIEADSFKNKIKRYVEQSTRNS
jgi:tetraacyldisaccharide 4'-kinase